MLERLCELWALGRVESNVGWYLANTWFSGLAAQGVTARIDAMCRAIDGPCALELVKSFGIPEELLEGIPIASDWERVME